MTVTALEPATAPAPVAEDAICELATMTSEDGDVKLRWSPLNQSEVDVARKAFNELKRTHLMWAKDASGAEVQVHTFDPTLRKIVAHLPNAGG